MSADNDLGYKRIPRDEGILIIDKLLSTGWTSMLDMCIALNDYALNNGCQPFVARPEEDTLEFYVNLMENRGIYSGDIRSSYFYHMVEIWSTVNEGDLSAPNEGKRDKYIETIKKVTRKNISEYDVSEATRTYLFHAPHVRAIRLFRYKKLGTSISNDLNYYNEKWDKHSSNKNDQEALASVIYDINDAYKHSVFSPDPDIIRRKVKAAEIRALQEALIKETTMEIQRRLERIAQLNNTRPAGWIEETTTNYFKAIYEGIDIVDNGFLEPIIQQFCSYLMEHLRVEYFPSDSLSEVVDYFQANRSTEHPQTVTEMVSLLLKGDLSKSEVDRISSTCLSLLRYPYNQNYNDIKSAIRELSTSSHYILCLLKTRIELMKVRLGVSPDIDTIFDSCYELFWVIWMFYNREKPKCQKAEEAFLQECEALKEVLVTKDQKHLFMVGLAEMTSFYVSRNAQFSLKRFFTPESVSIGLQGLKKRSVDNFYEMYQPICFDLNRKQLSSLIENDINTQEVVDTLVLFLHHFFRCVLINEFLFLSARKQRLLEVFENLYNSFSVSSGSLNTKKSLILITYALITIIDDPYPLGYVESSNPNACSETYSRILIEAHNAGMNEEEMQLMYIMLSMIGLNNYKTPYYKQGYEIGVVFAKQVDELVDNLIPSDEKRILKEAIKDIYESGSFYGFFH